MHIVASALLALVLQVEHPVVPQPAQSDFDVVKGAYEVALKTDSGGYFGDKDPKAAARAGKSVTDYVIGCLSPTLVERTSKLLKLLRAEGFWPSVTSGFRDDYRQSMIKTTYHAGVGWSLHGGSKRTRGCGDGRAVDIISVVGFTALERSTNSAAMWKRIGKIAHKVGLEQPMPDDDIAHVQLEGQQQVAKKHKKKKSGKKHIRVASR